MKPGAKFDQKKPRWSLLPLPAIQALIGVLEYGAQKYGEKDIPNWKQVPDARRRYYDACHRHLAAWWQGEVMDESGHRHLAHALACVVFLLALELEDQTRV